MECINCHERIGSERMLNGFYICSENHVQCRQCADKMRHQCSICGDMELNEYIFNIKPLKIGKTVSTVSVEMLRKPPEKTSFLNDNPEETISAEISFVSEQNKPQDPPSGQKLLSDNKQLPCKSSTTISRAETAYITDDGKIVKEAIEIKRPVPSPENSSFSNNYDQPGSSIREQCTPDKMLTFQNARPDHKVKNSVENTDQEIVKQNGRMRKLEINQDSFIDKEMGPYSTYNFSQPQLQKEWRKEESFIEEVPHGRTDSPLSFNPFYEEIRIIDEPIVQDPLPCPEQVPWQRIEEFIKQEISLCIREFFSSDNIHKLFNNINLNTNKLEEDEEEIVKCSKAVSTFSEPCLKIFQVHVPHMPANYAEILTATQTQSNKKCLSNAPYMDQQMKLLKAYRECSLPLAVDNPVYPDIEPQWWRGHIPTAPEPDTESGKQTKGQTMQNNEQIELDVQKKVCQEKEQKMPLETCELKEVKRANTFLVRSEETKNIDKLKKRGLSQNEMKVVIKKTDQILNEVLCKSDAVVNDSEETLTARVQSRLEWNKTKTKMEEKLRKDTIKAKLQSTLKAETEDPRDSILSVKIMPGELDLIKKQSKTKIVYETKKLPMMFRVLYNPKGVLLCPIHVMIPCCCDFKTLGRPPMSQPTISLGNKKYYRLESPQILRMRYLKYAHEPIYCPDALCRRSFLPTDCSKHYTLEHHNQPLYDIRIGQRLNFKLNPCPSLSNHACSQLLILINDRIREFGSTQYQNSMPLLVMTAKMKLTYLLGYQLRENSRLIESDEDYLLIWILGVVTPELKNTTYTLTTWRYKKEKPLCHISQTLNVLDIKERQIPLNIYQNADGLLLTPEELYLLTDSHKEFIQCQVEVHANN